MRKFENNNQEKHNNNREKTEEQKITRKIEVCVCVLHIKPFFFPVDIQHNQSVSVPILQS